MTQGIELSPSQEKVVIGVTEWLESSGGDRSTTVGGYAGTGKTTILGYLAKHALGDWDVRYCCFTGRAARVLSIVLKAQDLKATASTIHRLIYKLEWEDGVPRFNLTKDPIGIAGRTLVIVDEGSMVGRRIYDDLHTVAPLPKILFVGDHGQLPPVADDVVYLMQEPIFRLEEIHRQARGNPIIGMSAKIRRGIVRFPVKTESRDGNTLRIVQSGTNGHAMVAGEWVDKYKKGEDCLIVVGFNRTRVELNARIRSDLGHNGHPCVGERVVCLENNYQYGVVNGMITTVRSLSILDGDRYLVGLRIDDSGEEITVPVSRHAFGLERAQPSWQAARDLGISRAEYGVPFDYAYAVTCHKAQGTQAQSVMVYAEGERRWGDDYKRWMYTAVTRASEHLVMVV